MEQKKKYYALQFFVTKSSVFDTHRGAFYPFLVDNQIINDFNAILCFIANSLSINSLY